MFWFSQAKYTLDSMLSTRMCRMGDCACIVLMVHLEGMSYTLNYLSIDALNTLILFAFNCTYVTSDV